MNKQLKQRANQGVKIGITVVILAWILLFYLISFWHDNETGLSGSFYIFNIFLHNFWRPAKALHLDYLFASILFLRWWILAVVLFSVIRIRLFEPAKRKIKLFYQKFGIEIILLILIVRVISRFYLVKDCIFTQNFDNWQTGWLPLYFLVNCSPDFSRNVIFSFFIYLSSAISFLGWCVLISFVIHYLLGKVKSFGDLVLYPFRSAKFAGELALYFLTFGIELIINTIRLYMIFIFLYVPILIGAIFYIAYIGQGNNKEWTNVPFEVAGFWGWWIPAILGSINLAMSLGIFFGWNAPVSGIKLSFDSRDMTSEEKDFMIRFYRRLVESGRGNEQVFKSWNIIESSGVFAFTYGANIFISRGSFTERYFNALVAHEIGHLHNRDGLVLQALHSFTYPLFNHLLFNPTTIQKGVIEQDKDFNKPNSLLSGIISSMTITFFTLIFGGWSVQALARFWSKFYIERDYLADDYAIELGFAGELLNYLDSYKDFDTALPLFNRWRGYTRVRIERIRVKIEMSY